MRTAAGEGDPPRLTAGAEDELLASQTLPAVELERVLVEKACGAGTLEHAHARRFELTLQLLFREPRTRYAARG